MELRDIERMDLPGGDRLVAIFRRQEELMIKYEHIERYSGLLQTPDVPVDLDSREGQARLKDFAWRITEELAEALRALDDAPKDYVRYHGVFQEEIADALHFLMEFTILCGITPHEIADLRDLKSGAFGKDMLDMVFSPYRVDTGGEPVDMLRKVGKFIKDLGLACNLLKNKPWKQRITKTDVPAFKEKVIQVWRSFASIVYVSDITSQEIFELYFGKSEVNKKRQDSGY